MRKTTTMKLIHLLAAAGLVGALAAGCNTGSPIQGCDRPNIAFNPCSGLCSTVPFSPRCQICVDDPFACDPRATAENGTGGSGGGDGACTNEVDSATYDALDYTTGGGVDETGSDAASAIASDCVFGSFTSVPENPGCGPEAQSVLGCAATGCPPATVEALATCVVDCTQGIIDEVTGSMLTEDCADCYGDSVSCSASLCATSGCSNPTSPGCIQCRCENDCTPGFERCSGLPPSGDCG